MKFACSECGARIEATERFFGRDVGCPTCGRMIHVPRPEENTGVSTKADLSPPPTAAAFSKAAPAVAKSPSDTPSAAKKAPPADPPKPVEARPAPPPVRLPGSVAPSQVSPSVRRGGGGFGGFLLFLLVLAVGYGWGRYRGRELPPAAGPTTENPRQAQGSSLAAAAMPTPVSGLGADSVPASTAIPPASGTDETPESTPTSAASPGLAAEHALPSTTASPPTPAVMASPVTAMTPSPNPATLVLSTPAPANPTTGTPAATSPSPRKKRVSYFGTTDVPVEEEGAGEPAPAPAVPFPTAGPTLPTGFNNPAQTLESLFGKRATLDGVGTLRLTKAVDPLPGSVLNFLSPDAWLLLENVSAEDAIANLLPRMWIKGVAAALGTNVRVAQHGSGCLIIPQGPDFTAMQVFGGSGLGGPSLPLRCGVKYNAESLESAKLSVGSFRLKRGYMATIAQEENGTGVSHNYVAQERDLEVRQIPMDMEGRVRFVRVFPWRWTSKKGVAGGIHQNLKVSWFYNWNISEDSRPGLEYVPIRQNRWWPGLDQDWLARGSTHLLGFNEPDHKDQSNLNVDDAIHAWPELLGTGLRLGSPAVSDGGLGWLFDFMHKADAAHLRVDFVAVHYYRAVGNPSDAKGAAAQMYNFLKGIYDRTHRPLWVTEWNNGANWTGHKPTYEQEKAAVAAMVDMLDRTPFVERYAIYNWVEDERNVQRKDGSLTPAGEVYRDKVAPLAYTQAGP